MAQADTEVASLIDTAAVTAKSIEKGAAVRSTIPIVTLVGLMLGGMQWWNQSNIEDLRAATETVQYRGATDERLEALEVRMEALDKELGEIRESLAAIGTLQVELADEWHDDYAQLRSALKIEPAVPYRPRSAKAKAEVLRSIR